MNTANYISNWLKDYAINIKKEGYVIGISGGVDSALTSTLCAMTGLETYCLMMPINQAHNQVLRAHNHVQWLQSKFPNIKFSNVPLTKPFNELCWVLPHTLHFSDTDKNELVLANTKSRLRMVTLYAYATTHNLLVAGTGNKVEDFGIGFFTKYGDGGVDVSPIGDLTKTQVWELAKELGINQEIIDATPTDGLWEDNRGDESQIGASYPELEWAMAIDLGEKDWNDNDEAILDSRKSEVFKIYQNYHNKNKHKMKMPPICLAPDKEI
jgi:NAD+ synthase